MQIALWSNMHGQAGTSATTAALASAIAQRTAYKMLVAHNHFERSALEGYFFKQTGQLGQTIPGLNNQGMDALARLMRNGRLKPEMIADYTFSFLKNHRLDILLGTSKKEKSGPEDEGTLMSILGSAKGFYDLVLMDVHSGLNEVNSCNILESSDVVIFCITQNRFLLDDFVKSIESCSFLKEKRCVYVITRYERQSSLSVGNIARHYHLSKSDLFTIPNNIRFSDALNHGKVFDFIAYYQKSREGEEKSFIESVDRLCSHIIEGCAH